MFGLLSVHQNYFLTVGEYDSLKRTQHIIGSQLPCLFIDFDLIQTREADKISKTNFKNYAGSFRLKKFLELDTVGTKIVPKFDDTFVSTREHFGLKPITGTQEMMVTHISLLNEFINLHWKELDVYKKYQDKGNTQKINGINSFSEFVLEQTGTDSFVNELVDYETQQIQSNTGVLGNHTKHLQQSLMNINYSNINLHDLVARLNQEIEAIPPIFAFGQKRISEMLQRQAQKALLMARKSINA